MTLDVSHFVMSEIFTILGSQTHRQENHAKDYLSR